MWKRDSMEGKVTLKTLNSEMKRGSTSFLPPPAWDGKQRKLPYCIEEQLRSKRSKSSVCSTRHKTRGHSHIRTCSDLRNRVSQHLKYYDDSGRRVKVEID